MKRKTIRYTVLRNRIGNYLWWWERRAGLTPDWGVNPNPWSAKNFHSNPNELSTARKHFKSPEWTLVEGILSWREK